MKKCALHNHINAVSQSQTVCQLSRINQIEPCIFFDQRMNHFFGQFSANLLCAILRIQYKYAVFFQAFCQVVSAV